MRKTALLLIAAIAVPLLPPSFVDARQDAGAVIPGDREVAQPRVDVAILLDTSNSMDGLINQAKTQLWTIVQQFAKARKDGRAPKLRVALFEYGNTNLPASEGYIRQVVPLSDDLDKLSEALFALKTNGGDEYCGQVIDEAVKRLDWSTATGSYKAIFIAGNEPFTQGQVDFRPVCAKASNHGIVVNTIHCGDRATGMRTQWYEGARLGGGEFFNINQDNVRPEIPCPQDPIILKLNVELNQTYLWYGKEETRRGYHDNQSRQDSNAGGMGAGAAGSRAAAKASSAYDNTGRDLVDSLEKDEKVLEKLADDELPDELKKLTKEARIELIKKMAETRAKLKAAIGKLAAEREAFIAAELAKQKDGNAEKTLGDAMSDAVRSQLKSSGYATDVPTTSPSK